MASDHSLLILGGSLAGDAWCTSGIAKGTLSPGAGIKLGAGFNMGIAGRLGSSGRGLLPRVFLSTCSRAGGWSLFSSWETWFRILDRGMSLEGLGTGAAAAGAAG